MLLNEVTRRQLINVARSTDKNRFNKRLQYRPLTFQGVNLDDFFNKDRLTYTTVVGDYQVIISFEGALTELVNQLKSTNKLCTLRDMIISLSRSFDKADDIRVRCSCDDFKYRFAYWATIGKYIYGDTQMVPPKYKRTNADGYGSSCKHVLSVLSNKNWIIKVASVINNYIRMYKDDTYDYIYEKPPIDDDDNVDPNQISIFDDDLLDDDDSENYDLDQDEDSNDESEDNNED